LLRVAKWRDHRAKATISTHQSCRTSPLLRTVVEAKRKQGAGVRTPNTKRPKSVADVQIAATVAIADSPIREQETPVVSVPSQWTTVGPKRKARKPKAPSEKKVRPNALIIRSVGEVTYAEILQKVNRRSEGDCSWQE